MCVFLCAFFSFSCSSFDNARNFYLFSTPDDDMRRRGFINQTQPISLDPIDFINCTHFNQENERTFSSDHNIGWWTHFEDGKTCSSVLFLMDQMDFYMVWRCVRVRMRVCVCVCVVIQNNESERQHPALFK